MDWIWYLFGFKGRINRAKYWLAGLIIGCWMIFLMLLLFVPVGYLFGWPGKLHFSIDNMFAIFNPHSFRGLSRSDIGAIIVNLLTMPLFLWVFFATTVKRLHDRGRSAWWTVPFIVAPGLYHQFQGQLGDSLAADALGIVASILYIWGAVELYFLRGTRWTNQYGPNPLGKEQMRARSAQARLRATTAWDQDSEIEMVPHRAGPPPLWRVKRKT
ncbi:MAG TPA: DUF805 domain-containing protein [Bradyrhizobium sp.]|nr:DUF805 domain-containing protein [Bradyrhizobium sp.]